MRRIFLGVVLAALSAASLTAQTVHQVERVIDGDTLVLVGLGSVRLIGIDTPESHADAAAAFLRKLVTGQPVRVEYDQPRKDKYGRTLAYLYLPDETFVNAEIIRQGFSPAYTDYPFKFLAAFRVLERQAMEARRGLWGAPSAPPIRTAAAPASRPAVAAAASGATRETTVYVTRTGEKYHRAGCRHLARS